MYIIVNKTLGTEIKYQGNFPYDILIEMLESGNDLIVISTYSNTIKVPYLDEESYNYGETKSGKNWMFRDFNIPKF